MSLTTTLMKRAAFFVVPVTALTLPGIAHAHHAMDGKMPSTFAEGVLSGLAHPVIGPDHLAFIIGVGLLAAVAGFGVLLPVLFVVAMCAGLALHMLAFELPAVELLIALSVLAIGAAIALRNTRGGSWMEGALFSLAGVAHGYAFAESIIGAEQTPLVAYIAGLVVVQSLIAVSAFMMGRMIVTGRTPVPAAVTRAAGIAIAVAGAYFLAGASGVIA